MSYECLKACVADHFTDRQLEAMLLMRDAEWSDREIARFFGIPRAEVTAALWQIDAETDASERPLV